MLEEYRQSYETCADLIHDWKHKSVYELANNYLKFKNSNNDIYNSYLSAIIVKFWHTINTNYTKQEYKIATEEDCYDWLIKSIMYVLDHHVWTDPNSTIYNDKEGPTKAILVRIESERINFFVASKRKKRVLNRDKYYLEDLSNIIETDKGTYDWALPKVFDKDDLFEELVNKKVVQFFNEKKYFSAFALDAIINNDVFRTAIDGGKHYTYFEPKAMKYYFKHCDKSFCNVFSKKYNINLDDVQQSFKYISNISDDNFYAYLRNLLCTLKNDDVIMQYVI